MAIQTKAELFTETLAWVNREGDTDLLAKLETVLGLLESDLNRRLRHRATKADLDIAADDETVALPSDVAELRTIRYKNDDLVIDAREIMPRTPSQLNELRAHFHLTAGQPRYFSVFDGNLELVPKSDDDYTVELMYLAGYVFLDDDESLLATNNDLYLYGMQVHLAPFLEHDERLPVWEKKFEAALADQNLKREREEFAMLSRQPMRLPRVFGGRP